jgi:hypothetical protein
MLHEAIFAVSCNSILGTEHRLLLRNGHGAMATVLYDLNSS